MSLSQAMLPEFDHEMANTRKSLERIPEAKLGWKPHEKSWSMGDLASHLANLPGWAVLTINVDSFDLAPPGAPSVKSPRAGSLKEALEMFDKNVVAARAARLAGAGDAHLLKPWILLSGGKVVLTLPRIALLRSFVMNHNIHHRAQLGVYLRLNDVPVPSIYGPSADEGAM